MKDINELALVKLMRIYKKEKKGDVIMYRDMAQHFIDSGFVVLEEGETLEELHRMISGLIHAYVLPGDPYSYDELLEMWKKYQKAHTDINSKDSICEDVAKWAIKEDLANFYRVENEAELIEQMIWFKENFLRNESENKERSIKSNKLKI